MSILFKYYWHIKQYGSQTWQVEEKVLYQHTCDDTQKLAIALEKAKSLVPNLLVVVHRDGHVAIYASNLAQFIEYIESYVRWVARQDNLTPNLEDLKNREQIRIVPFVEQQEIIFELLRQLVTKFRNNKIFFRELDVNDLELGDYEKFCQEEVLISLHLQGRLYIRDGVYSKTQYIGGKDFYIWFANTEFQNQLSYGPFLLDYESETIKFENQNPLHYATTKHKPYAWAVVFTMLIAAKGEYVTSRVILNVLRSHGIELPVARAVIELRQKFRENRIPAGYFPRALPGRGSSGYHLRSSLL